MINNNMTNMAIGTVGWVMAAAPTWFDNLNGFIAISSSSLGLVLLFITIRTGIVNHKIRRLEYLEKEQAYEDRVKKYSKNQINNN